MARSDKIYDLATYDVATVALVGEPIVVRVPNRSYLYRGIAWTKAGVVLPFSTDGEPQVGLVFAVTT